jgi:hypothetical protein
MSVGAHRLFCLRLSSESPTGINTSLVWTAYADLGEKHPYKNKVKEATTALSVHLFGENTVYCSNRGIMTYIRGLKSSL